MFNIHIEFERWKFNKEYNVYVSSLGRVKDKKKKLIEPLVGTNGYFTLFLNDRIIAIHTLVMITFKGYSKGMTVDHINSNRRDNRLKNLEYVTQEENLKRAQNKLMKNEVIVDLLGDNPEEVLDLLYQSKIFSIEHLNSVLDSKEVKEAIKKTCKREMIVAGSPDAWARKYLRYHTLDGVADFKTFSYRVSVYAKMDREYCGYKLSIVDGLICGQRVC